MVLNTETIEVLYMRNGLGRFHLSAAPLQCEYDHCIHDFARAIEAEVRKQDEALIRQLVDALAPFAYENPAREAIAAGRARLSGFGCRDTEGVGLDELLCGSNGELK